MTGSASPQRGGIVIGLALILLGGSPCSSRPPGRASAGRSGSSRRASPSSWGRSPSAAPVAAAWRRWAGWSRWSASCWRSRSSTTCTRRGPTRGRSWHRAGSGSGSPSTVSSPAAATTSAAALAPWSRASSIFLVGFLFFEGVIDLSDGRFGRPHRRRGPAPAGRDRRRRPRSAPSSRAPGAAVRAAPRPATGERGRAGGAGAARPRQPARAGPRPRDTARRHLASRSTARPTPRSW